LTTVVNFPTIIIVRSPFNKLLFIRHHKHTRSSVQATKKKKNSFFFFLFNIYLTFFPHQS
jgi:hypothetical protein